MIIQSSNIGMNSKRSYEACSSSYRSMTAWGHNKLSQTKEAASSYVSEYSENGTPTEGETSFSDSMNHILDKFNEAQSISSPKMSHAASSIKNMHQQIYDYLLCWLFGGKMPSENLANTGEGTATQQDGGAYESSFFFCEQETTSYSATGKVVTADGRSIDFNMSVYMSRSFTEYATEHLDFGEPLMIDPLVINLDSSPVSVSDQKFYFDLDADGHDEYISMLNAGSGYLALDKNKDGVVNDGSELFGTSSGDAFADLAQYDEDRNGWIDENDPVFDELMIWRKDANGNDRLCSIGKAGVGAVYLGSSDTQFSLNSERNNHTNAMVRKTGMFLYENGNTGTIQQLDLAQ